jgi:hypothetical protein
MIIGQSSLNQLYETLAACEDCPLLADTVEKVQKFGKWPKTRHRLTIIIDTNKVDVVAKLISQGSIL